MAEVKIYSTPTCPYCIRLKDYLKQKNIDFVNFDVSQDKAALEEMVELTGQMGVPVIVIDKEHIVGFNKPEIDNLLNIG